MCDGAGEETGDGELACNGAENSGGEGSTGGASVNRGIVVALGWEGDERPHKSFNAEVFDAILGDGAGDEAAEVVFGTDKFDPDFARLPRSNKSSAMVRDSNYRRYTVRWTQSMLRECTERGPSGN